MATYRTRTYIAGDWDNDKDAVDQLHKWNDSNYWNLSFTDAHDLTSSRDSSLNCTIKASLKTRMDASKHSFLLLVIILRLLQPVAANCAEATTAILNTVRRDTASITVALSSLNVIKLLKLV